MTKAYISVEFDTNLSERLSDELAQVMCIKIQNLLKADPLVRSFYVETTDGPQDGEELEDDELDDWEDDLEDPLDNVLGDFLGGLYG